MNKVISLIVLGFLVSPAICYSQNAGDSLRVDYGEVISVEHVKLKSKAGQGAALGGLAGLAASHKKSGHDKAKSAAAGAALGMLLAKAAQGKRDGAQYTVELRTGSRVSYITEPRDIRKGDCVAVEQGDHVNLRRVSSAMCEHEHEVTKDYHAADHGEAQECQLAKKSLLDAETESEAQVAAVKIQVLCHH